MVLNIEKNGEQDKDLPQERLENTDQDLCSTFSDKGILFLQKSTCKIANLTFLPSV